jgi:hypothetical protein
MVVADGVYGYYASYRLWGNGEDSTKKVGWEKEWVGGWVKSYGVAGFCGLCVCLGIFLLLYWRVFVSGIARGWDWVYCIG